jgi:hypothetical protein
VGGTAVTEQKLTEPDRLAISPTKPWPLPLSAYVILHGVWFLLYALFGKGFAYAGFPPLFAGEMLLLAGLGVLLGSRRVCSLVKTPLGVLMVAFLVFQIACSLPYVETYGLDTLRDSVIWAYAGFGWVAAALVLRLPGLLRSALVQFRNFSRIFLVLGPAAWMATLYFSDALPHWPGTNVSIPSVKGGEFCVHLAGVFAFILLELSPMSRLWLLLAGADALLGMRARGGLLAFLLAALFAFGIRPRLDRLMALVGAGLVLLVAMATFDVRVVIPDSTREFSLKQLSDSVTSIFRSGDYGELESTKVWRLAWWNKIWDYTVGGPYYWTGKGYGVNLADSDGFQVGTRDEPLRSPHSSHLTFLARSGVPGFLLWVGLQLAWACSMARSYLEASRRNAAEFARLFAWLLTYWVAFTVSAGFDVFLEGPMAGIPFWTIFGLGWGSHVLFQSCSGHTGVRPATHNRQAPVYA